jgi:hypothetical protein
VSRGDISLLQIGKQSQVLNLATLVRRTHGDIGEEPNSNDCPQSFELPVMKQWDVTAETTLPSQLWTAFIKSERSYSAEEAGARRTPSLDLGQTFCFLGRW